MIRISTILPVFGLVLAACAEWPIGRQLDKRTSGLVGEWVALDVQRDTLLWKFRKDGSAELHALREGRDAGGASARSDERVWRDSWRVYESLLEDPRHLMCTGYRLGRTWPSCRAFQIDTVDVGSSILAPRRRVIWETWAGEQRTTTDTLLERRQ